MIAELIAVGSELLRFGRRDTNSEWLSERLHRIGVEVRSRSIVVDDPGRIAARIREALGQVDVLLVCGGLGPTEDDRTREALALALAVQLERDEQRVAWLRRQFARRGFPFRDVQARQAERPRGSQWVDNPLGTAPGVRITRNGTTIVALPGVPAELKAMFESSVLPLLEARVRRTLVRRTLKVAGRAESSVDLQVRDLYGAEGVAVTILSGREGIELHIRAEGSEPAEAASRLATIEDELANRLGLDLYGRDDQSLPEVVGGLLGRSRRTLGTAESCTAGMLAAAITRVPGASSWFRGGLVVYNNALKESLAGVPARTIEQFGAVSEETVRALARGARRVCATDYGLGITGIAGPSGGSADKPVGTMHVALDGASGSSHWKANLIGDRSLIRHRAVTLALDRLRRCLLEATP